MKIHCLLPIALLPALCFAQQEPPIVKRAFSLAPGTADQLRNVSFLTVEINSDYPVQVIAGSCRVKSDVHRVCRLTHPWDVFIRDLRSETKDVNVRANSITVTFSNPTDAAPAPDNSAAASPAPPPDPPAAKQRIRSYLLRQGQKVVISNTDWPTLEIHSSGPIDVAAGDCFSEFTFKIECHGPPSDIVIKDVRAPQQTGTNLVVVTAKNP